MLTALLGKQYLLRFQLLVSIMQFVLQNLIFDPKIQLAE